MARSGAVKVSKRFQISIPAHARRELGIEAGDRLMIVVGDGMLFLIPEPDDFTTYTAGLHREVWQGIDTTAYLKEEREARSTAEEA